MLNKTIFIRSDFITLAQLLKFANVISSGGEAKQYLTTHNVVINGIVDNRRGRKLYDGDKVTIDNNLCLTLTKNKI